MAAPLRIACYVDLRYTTRQPTGVDKHIARMVHGLAATPGFGVSVLAPRAQLAGPGGSIPAASSLAGLPATALPFSNRQARMLWFFEQVCRHADLVISVSHHLEGFLIDRFGLEAMAAGLPVIARRSTAVPETAGDAAIYLEEKGTGSFCEAKGACPLFSRSG